MCPGSHGRLRRNVARLVVILLVTPPVPPPSVAAAGPAGSSWLLDSAGPAEGLQEESQPATGHPPCRDSLETGAYPDLSTSSGELWPPNHRLVDVGLRVDVGPACRGRAGVVVAVHSDEPDDAEGDGATIHDAQIDPPDLYVRAERQGGSDGRVYLVVATASHEGISSRACGAIVVPLSRSAAHRRAVEEQAARAVEECRLGGVPAGFHRLFEGPLVGANRAPAVDAGPDQGVELGAAARLAGTVTDDGLPDGRLLVTWSLADGPGEVVFSAPASPSTDVSFERAGTYVLRLTGNDGELEAFDDVRVVVHVSNAAPAVHAGPDRLVTLPERSLLLEGVVTDDGRLLPEPIVTWSLVSGPGPVAFDPPSAPRTTATVSEAGAYVLRLTAHDGQIEASDDVWVTVAAEPPPTVDVEDVSVSEGDEGLTGASVAVRLSKPWPHPVSVDWVTEDVTAYRPCDYARRYGTLTFAPGETVRPALVPVVGDRAPEGDEDFSVLLGNPDGAVLGRDAAVVRIGDDDNGENRPPLLHSDRSPPDRANAVNSPVLSWLSADPDPDDALLHDVFLGTTFTPSGQQWLPVCPGGAAPGPRWAAVSGHDEASDRLVVYGGETPGGAADGDLWILENATAAGGPPTWLRLPLADGPGPLAWAAGGYDPVGRRLVVFGGCGAGCSSPSGETWRLEGADGRDGLPEWRRLDVSGPGPRAGAAAAYDADRDRLFILGGSTGGVEDGGLWVLEGASRSAVPAWRLIDAGGDVPAARRDAGLAWDGRDGRLVLFGGRTSNGETFGDVHVLAPDRGSPRWERLEPEGEAPAARFGAAVAWHGGSGRLLVHGGSTAESEGRHYVFADGWLLAVAGERPRWFRMGDGGFLPPGRYAAATALSESASRLVVTGGANEKLASPPDDLWLLDGAAGRLPLVAAGLAEPAYSAPEAANGEVFHWRVVTRDRRGAWRGSPAWSFTANRPPSVDAGPDRSFEGVPAAAALVGTVDDDALPAGSTLEVVWEAVSGPGTVLFDDPASATTTAHFGAPGLYLLRLSATDGQASASDGVAVEVRPLNRAPLVDAGEDLAGVTEGGTALLTGTVSDDGVPDTSLAASWSQIAGPAPVEIASPSEATTLVRFPAAGTYILRLTADDGELQASDDVSVVVSPVNQGPRVSAGGDRTLSDPAVELALVGEVTDDGLPGGPLAVRWTGVEGPFPVTFSDAAAAVTTVRFGGPGRFVLRLEATDGELSASDEAVVFVASAGLLPDLAVRRVDTTRLAVDPGALVLGGAVVVEVANRGPGTAAGPFLLTLFEDRDADGSLDRVADALLAETSLAGLEAGASTLIELDVSGSTVFAGNLVHAFVDSAFSVEETDEENNLGSSAPGCGAPGSSDGWTVALEWSWTATEVDPVSTLVLNAPIVLDVNSDGLPDILFVAHGTRRDSIGYASNGRLRALSGDDGSELWSVVDPQWNLTGASRNAGADIDGDGRPEIIGVAEGGRALLAFEHDGTPKWTSDAIQDVGWGAPSIADLDADGVPEIVVGRQVLTSEGRLLWTGAFSGRGGVHGAHSVVVDLDLDGLPEVLVGNTAYRGQGPSAGEALWRNTNSVDGVTIGDGYTAVGQFDDGPYPEIVLVTNGWVFLLEHDGTVKWGPRFLEPVRAGNSAGPPTVADVDGDGGLEIAVAGSKWIAVLDADGSHMWRVPNVDTTPNVGIAAFDFDGDGAAELVHAAQEDLRVFRGSDGVVLFRDTNGSGTVSDSVVVADVDGDGEAEIVSVTDGYFGTVVPGVRVYGEAGGRWAHARRVWNQFQYSVTNVDDLLTVPRREARDLRLGHRWAMAGSVRDGDLAPTCAFPRPDLTASAFRLDASPTEWRLTARIGNGGARVAGAGVPVSFYDGDPRAGAARLGTVSTTALLHPGRFEDVVLVLSRSQTTRGSVFVSADDRGGLRGRVLESNEENNLYDTGRALLASTDLPDLVVGDLDPSATSVDARTLAVSGTAVARVRNLVAVPVERSFDVTFFEDRDRDGGFGEGDAVLGRATVEAVGALESVGVSAALAGSVRFLGSPVHVLVDSGGGIPEADETNNVARSGASCRVRPASGPWSLREEWAGAAGTALLSTPAVGDLDADGVPDVAFAVTRGTATSTDGQLRAVSGRDGSELFAVTDRSLDVNPSAHLALGDLDGDGRPEIVAVGEQGAELLAFRANGGFLWRSPRLEASVGAAAPFLADLDRDGRGEVVVGRQALRGDGSLLWTGTGRVGRSAVTGVQSIAADLDLDGEPEVVAGSSAYRADGTLLWTASSVPDGVVAVANLDDDPYLEIVVVGSDLRVLEHDGAVKWGPIEVEGTGWPGPATLADFDGDGQTEIGVGGRNRYSVYEGYGHLRWTVATAQTDGRFNTGGAASAFDFDGDGALELVLADPGGLRILSGHDGSVLAEHPAATCNESHSYPVVADADADGKPEILLGSSDRCTSNPMVGLRAFGETSDRWASSRRAWSQYAHAVDSVRDDLRFPAPTVPPGLRENTWRANALGPGSPFASSDLTASFVRREEDVTSLRFTARVGNAGTGPVGPGLPVAFYNGDPRLDYPLLATTTTTRALEPGEYEDVSALVPSVTSALASVVVAVDDPGDRTSTVSECDEQNNLTDSGHWLNIPPTVSAGPDQTASLPHASLLLEGSVVDDGLPLQATVASRWLYFDGPIDPMLGGPVFSDPASPTTTASFPVAGVYRLRLRADDSRREGHDDVTVTVHPANEAPIVSAGPDRIVDLPEKTVQLEGSASDDGLPPGSALHVAWTVVSGPGPVAFVPPSSASTVASLSETGTYRLRLTATDGELSTNADVTVVLEPENESPVVDAGRDRRVFSLSTVLEGSATDDGKPRGSGLTSQWSLVAGPAAPLFGDPSNPQTAVAFPVPGSYVLRLTASDGVLSAHADVTITANPANEPPRVDAGPARSIASRRTALAGMATDDGLPAGSVLTVLWSQVSGPSPAVLETPLSPQTEVRFDAEGTYVFRLSAGDGEYSAEDTVEITVAFVNAAPMVDAGPDATIALPEATVSLAGSAADDELPLGSSLALRWHLASGPAPVAFDPPDAARSTARFTDPGTYVLVLRASDGALLAEDTVTVIVRPVPASGPPPSAQLRLPAAGSRLTLPADVVGTAASETLASWQLERRLRGDADWVRFASGTEPMADGVLGRLDPTLLLNGLHEVRLTVTDTAGRLARSTVPVVVRDQAKVGHFTVSFVDLEVPVAGLPLRVSRTYDSRDPRRGEFGHGWRLELANVRVQPAATLGLAWYGSVSAGAFGSYCLQPTAPPLVTLTFPDGRVQEFEVRLSPQCQPFVPIQTARVTLAPVGPTLGRLELPSGGDVEVVGSWPGPMQLFGAGYSLFDPALYRYVSPDGQVFVVDRAAGLRSLTDRAGNVLTMTPAGITTSHPEVAGSTIGLTFTRDAQGRITRVTDPDNRSLVYEYDADGDLVAVTDREGETTRFTYEEDLPHQLRDILDPLGRRPIRNEYTPDGRLVAHEDALGNRILYQHDLAGRQEIVRDRTGAQRVLEYDERGNVVRETDPQGRVVVRTFDSRNNRLSETEPFDPADPPDPIPTTRYTYDASDNLLSTSDPLGNATAYTYNSTRQVLTTTDAGGGITTNAYDAKGNLVSTTDALGSKTVYTHDARGNVLTQTVRVAGLEQLTRYQYDANGRLVRETDPLGHDTSHTYDRSGNRLTQTTTRTTPSGTETLVTRYEYDANGRMARTLDPDGTSAATIYDALGRQVESRDKLGRATSYEYDVMGRLTRTTHPDGTSEEHGYDAEGRRTSTTDRAGRTTRYEYDSLGRMVRTIHPDGAFTRSTYDEAGRLIASTDARDKATSYEYDAAGRRTAVVDPLGQRTTFAYDSNGNQRTVTDPRGHTVTYEYDLLNRRTRTIFPPTGPGETATFTETGHDELGRRVSETDQAGRTTRFEYDALGRLTAVVDALGQRTSYGYDELGNRVSQTDASGRTTSFEYDPLGRETKRILPAVTDPAEGPAVAAFETKTYDAAGNLTTRTDFRGRLTSYTYDESNRLLSRSYPDPLENVSFTYTPTGRRKTATDSRGTTTYSYDLRDRLDTLTYPDGRTLGYDYDPQGNTTKLTATLAALSLVTTQTFDPLARLATVTDPAGRSYVHSYDPSGNRASLAHPNGVLTSYTYDSLNRLTTLATTHAPSGRHVQSYAFTLGPAGNRTRIVEAQGLPHERTLDYSYDVLYRLTGETVTESLGLVYSKAFGYDPVGNRLTQATTIGPAGSPGPSLQPGTIGYAYDERDRLLSEQLDAAPATAYGWDTDGNLTTKDAEATYTWDHENRLTKVTKTDGTLVEHAYDADGNRVRTSVTPPTGPPTITDFLVDTSGPLSHVVAETDGALPAGARGSLKAFYLRGDDLLALMRPLVAAPASPSDWQTRHYHADGIGSIRRLTDEAGSITDGYTYSAFGELLAHTGQDPQAYAFTGEPLDPNSGWQYHRARWMDPRAGRFVGMDAFAGSTFDARSLHRYLYAHASPAGNIDPTGEFTVGQSVTVGAIIGVLAAQLIPPQSFEERLRVSAFGAILGGLGGALYAGAALGGLVVTLTGSSVWLIPPVIRGRFIERALGSNLPFNYPTIDRFANGVATSIKSIDLGAKTYQNLPTLAYTLRGYVDSVANWPGLARPWSWAPAIPGYLIKGRELVLAVPNGAGALQMQAVTQAQLYAARLNVQLTIVYVH